MKKLFKSIVAVMLCAVIAVTAFGADTAQAATKKMPLKVTMNGKSYTFTKDISKKVKKVSIKKVKKALGKPTNSGEDFWYWETEISAIACYKGTEYSEPYVEINIGEKEHSLSGIKCGMTKKSVLKKLKKYGYKESNLSIEEYPGFSTIDIPLYNDSDFIRIKFDENDKAYQVYAKLHVDTIK